MIPELFWPVGLLLCRKTCFEDSCLWELVVHFERSRDMLTPILLSTGRLMNRLTSDIGIVE